MTMFGKDSYVMIYEIENGKISVYESNGREMDEQKCFWGVYTFDDAKNVESTFGIKPGLFAPEYNKSTRFEDHDGFDYIFINVLNYQDLSAPFAKTGIYIRKNLIVFVTDNPPILQSIIDRLSGDTAKGISFNSLLFTYFDMITSDDAVFLENVEQGISDLESELISGTQKEYIKEIISLRRRLMALKRYYEQILNVMDALMENENNLIDGKSMHHFKIFAGRIDRLYHNVMNLRDYVTQVREAYQAQEDINLNNIMKLFTVITAIFMPLTLLVGWYGMNFKMPEYSWMHGYTGVIILSAVITTISLIIFKKKKWF